MSIEPGQQLLHYRLIQKIGEGGMGVVWKAEDTKLQRQVALKVLPEAMAADPDRQARFEREARAVAALNHPNIVTLHSVEEAETPAGSVHFITMELVEGRTLTQLLPKSGFPLKRLLEIGIPLADAVSRAHRAGITHRDLKPDNIMIDSEGRLRVLDFGLAKLHDPSAPTQGTQIATATSDTVEGRVLGTVAYMSPEQAEGKEIDTRSDIFSLGTILYEMATSVRPFQGETTMSTIGSILKEEPASITELRPTLPRHVGRILRRCLAKDPERRYQTAIDLRNELEELKQEIDSGVHATGPDAATRSRRFRVPLLMLAVVTLSVALFLVTWFRDSEALPAVEYVPRPVTATSDWDLEPSWSPDGKFIAFSRMASGNIDIYVQPIDGVDAVARAELPGEQSAVHWTPDGDYLSYLSKHRPGSPVFLSPVDGGTPRELIATHIPTLDFGDSLMGDRPWSNDGRTLLLSMPTAGGQSAVHKVDGDDGRGSSRSPSRRAAAAIPSRPTPSTASRSSSNGRSTGRDAVMLMPAVGGDPEVLLGDEFDYQNPAWRPDNRRVVFISTRDSAFRALFEIDVVTRKIRQPDERFSENQLCLGLGGRPDRLLHVLARPVFLHRGRGNGCAGTDHFAFRGQQGSSLLSRWSGPGLPIVPHRECGDLAAHLRWPAGDAVHRQRGQRLKAGVVTGRSTFGFHLGPDRWRAQTVRRECRWRHRGATAGGPSDQLGDRQLRPKQQPRDPVVTRR